MHSTLKIFMAVLLTGMYLDSSAAAEERCNADCSQFNLSPTASTPLQPVTLPPAAACTLQSKNGFPIPDPTCTPGAVNPSLTQPVLTDPGFRTCCVRNQSTSEQSKNATYDWYGISHPQNNHGQTQTCELDHLISLELGGADTLDNLWPQCGPDGVPLDQRYFKQKDLVENYLAKQVKAGEISLEDAQKGIASDWTQYLNDAAQAGQ